MGVAKVKAKKRWVIVRYPNEYRGGPGYSGSLCQSRAVFPGYIYDNKKEAETDRVKLAGPYPVRGVWKVVVYREAGTTAPAP